jgi:hypothetical protein
MKNILTYLRKEYMELKNNHGGKRKGSGRKPKYNEPTKVVSFRVPLSLVESITKYIKSIK